MKKVILTGDRPTGKLHIGHFIGSLKNRVKLQHEYDEYILIANIQALTDNFSTPEKVKDSISELLMDYYAVGIDFNIAKVYIQSEAPVVNEIFIYLSNFATIQQISHNPTIKSELSQKRLEKSTPLGFYMYPVHQAADILIVGADLVPTGPDQAPHVEMTRELAKKFNSIYKTDILKIPEILLGTQKNIPGIDGNEKMGKSLNNCIYLSDTKDNVRKKVFSMKTDPNRIHATDPGNIEGNTVFTYHDIFNPNTEEVNDLKERYTKGTVGDVEVKEKLFIAMEEILQPIREKRIEGEKKKDELLEIALENSKKVNEIGKELVEKMKDVMKIKFK